MRRTGVRVVKQRKNWDCGVACLVMLFDIPYGDVSAAARSLWGTPHPKNKRGLCIYHMEALAKALGKKLKRVHWKANRAHLTGRTGILGLNGGNMSWAGHWVILKSGPSGMFITDPDGGKAWDAVEYLTLNKTRPGILLVEE